jgi:hypothetical protein
MGVARQPGVGDLLEYENRANYVLAKYHDPVFCTYDLSKFSASVAIDVMRAHPMVIIVTGQWVPPLGMAVKRCQKIG